MELKPSPHDGDRAVMCDHYEGCLDVAINSHWQTFSCDLCGEYAPLQFGAADMRADASACAELIRCVFNPDYKRKKSISGFKRYTHLTDAAIRHISQMMDDGASLLEMAVLYNVDRRTIQRRMCGNNSRY